MKIAVIGAWHVHTQEYAQAILKNPQAQLVCLWDDDQARGQAMAQTLGVPFQPDLEAIWADSSIQGIQVTTATNQHKEVLLAAAKAGKYNGYLLEGMACPGGCVAGAGTMQSIKKSAAVVGMYAKQAEHQTATGTHHVAELDKLVD